MLWNASVLNGCAIAASDGRLGTVRPWRDQDLPLVLRADDEIMDAPISVFHEKVRDVTALAVAGMGMVPGNRFDAAEMRIAGPRQSSIRRIYNGRSSV